jgi:hypothetical protein
VPDSFPAGDVYASAPGYPIDQLRPARILLTACSAATLALNIAGPVTVGAYGRAAFDSVSPGLLIGRAKTGPGMLRFLYARRSLSDPPIDGNGPGSEAEADALSRRSGARARAADPRLT